MPAASETRDKDGAGPARKPRAGLASVLQQSTLYAIGNIASRLVAFLAIPIYSRFLTPAQYGLLELIELSTQTVAIAFGLQAIGTALTRIFHDQVSADAERSVVSTALIGTALLGILVTIASVAGAGPISRAVFGTDEWTTLLQTAFVAMLFASQIEVILVYERMRGHARFYLAYSLVTLGLSLVLNILFIGVLDAGVWGFVSSKIIVSVGGALFLAWRLRRDVGWHWRGAYVPEFVRFGAPLVLSGLSYFAIHFSDRFFLSSAVSLAELGRYALAYRFALMVNVLVGDSFAKSWNVSLYGHTGDTAWREGFARVAAYLTFMLASTGMAVAIFGPELLRVMVPASFYPPLLLLPILVLAYVLRDIADFFRSLLLINKRAGWVGKIALAAAAVNLVANVALIPAFGTHGAAWATLATWSAYLAVCWVVAQREHRLPIRLRPYGRLLLLMVAVYAAAAGFRVQGFVLQVVFDGLWVTLFVVVAALVFLSVTERRLALEQIGRMLAQMLVPVLPLRSLSGTGGHSLLMLAFFFPPQNEVGAARPYRFARALRRMGTPVTVICSPARRTAAGEGPHIGPEPAPIRVPTVLPDPPGPGRPRLDAISRGLHLLERATLPYDDRLAWLPHACVAAAAEITPDTILMSTHPPIVTHLAALALKQRTGQPWIADFSDPLLGNPFRSSYRASIVDPLLERLVVEHADAIIANTDSSAAALVQRYPAWSWKISTIWNGFDPEDVMQPLPLSDRVQRMISHIGTLYGTRTPLPFAASLDRLIAGGAILAENIQFRQIGRCDPNCLDPAEPVYQSLQRQGCFHAVLHGVPQPEARQEMLTADWLLLLDMNETNLGLQVPAKTFEYIRACRPILALTAPGSATERVLGWSGVPHVCVDFETDPDRFDAAVLDFFRSPLTEFTPSPRFLSEFDASSQTAALQAIVDRVRCGAPAAATAAMTRSTSASAR